MNDNEVGRRVYIFGRTNIQNSLLAQFLRDNLAYDCGHLSEEESPVDARRRESLVLIDHAYRTHEELACDLDRFTEQSESLVVAIANVEREDSHEHLIEWAVVRGLFYVDATRDQLLRGVQAIFDGECWFPRRLLDSYLRRHRSVCKRRSQRPALLTSKEQLILRHLAAGGSNKQIASQLKISDYTVKTHVYNIFKKLNVNNRVQALNWVQSNEELLENPFPTQASPHLNNTKYV